MGEYLITYYENYTPVGDVIVLALTLVFLVMIKRAYITRTKSFICLQHVIYILMVAAMADILFHV
ncbi:MAG: hypothetical protein J5489_05590, partial [Lachnospiraceae bacterium]|nr:hypothetical protein [Lachnospiraceae bacterium]